MTNPFSALHSNRLLSQALTIYHTRFFSQAKRTLRMLYNEQMKAGRDLERRIEKLKEEGKDPSQPQPLSTAPSTSSKPKNATAPPQWTVSPPPQVPNRTESPQPLQRMIDTVDESFMLLGVQRVSICVSAPPLLHLPYPIVVPTFHQRFGGAFCYSIPSAHSWFFVYAV